MTNPALPQSPPDSMPLRSNGQTRKRWRYVAVFAEELMMCAARAQVGPFTQTFWVAWDRHSGEQLDHTSLRPGGREVTMDGPVVEIAARDLRASLRLGESEPIETTCPSGSSWAWTRKRAGMRVTGTIESGGRRREIEGRGVDDESAGYHRRHTNWHWSAGVGRAADGRELAWNLVEGINDPVEGSERAIWVDGAPREPAPVSFEGLDAIDLDDRSRLEFENESERTRSDNMLFLRSSYRLRFGTFTGSFGPGLDLAEGLGVMERHDAVW